MIIAHVARNLREANYNAQEWMRNNRAIKVTRRTYPIIWDKENEHHFIPEAIFNRWCIGRTYYTGNGVLCRSGEPIGILSEQNL